MDTIAVDQSERDLDCDKLRQVNVHPSPPVRADLFFALNLFLISFMMEGERELFTIGVVTCQQTCALQYGTSSAMKNRNPKSQKSTRMAFMALLRKPLQRPGTTCARLLWTSPSMVSQ